jgi:hypothetical protein
MAYRVLIIGVGNLGFRYLQGLWLVSSPLEITVIDKSQKALRLAEEEYKRTRINHPHTAKFAESVEGLSGQIDLAISATTASNRFSTLSAIRNQLHVRNWILEKVLVQSLSDLDGLSELMNYECRAWVNTPRLEWQLYKELVKRSAPQPIVKACFGNFGGLACNAIHYIDLVCRWSDTSLQYVDVSCLGPEWFQAKRSGFYEIDGFLSCKFSNGSILKLYCDSQKPDGVGIVSVDNECWSIDEKNGVAVSNEGDVVRGMGALQSELTSSVVESILLNGACNLPLLSQSVLQHRVLLEALISHWNSCMKDKAARLPIT